MPGRGHTARTADKPLPRKPQRYCRSCSNKVLGKKTRCWECEYQDLKIKNALRDKREQR
jgi:hypothetical protein